MEFPGYNKKQIMAGGGVRMPKTVSIGLQDFRKIQELDTFYIDKTSFIEEWWEAKDDVTLITRPRRFGKTLTMSMVESFFFCGTGGQQAV